MINVNVDSLDTTVSFLNDDILIPIKDKPYKFTAGFDFIINELKLNDLVNLVYDKLSCVICKDDYIVYLLDDEIIVEGLNNFFYDSFPNDLFYFKSPFLFLIQNNIFKTLDESNFWINQNK